MRTPLIAGLCLVGALTACGEEPLTEPCPAIDKFSIAPQHLTLAVGDSSKLTAQVDVPEGEHVRIDWGTTDAGVVTVSGSGWATGEEPGEAFVVASPSVSLDGGACPQAQRDSTSVEVTSP